MGTWPALNRSYPIQIVLQCSTLVRGHLINFPACFRVSTLEPRIADAASIHAGGSVRSYVQTNPSGSAGPCHGALRLAKFRRHFFLS